MRNLTLTLEEEIALLHKYNLNSNELLVLRCIVMLQEEKQELLFQSLMAMLNNNNLDLRSILLSLQNKGIILKSYKIPEKGQSFDPYSIQLNKNFVKQLYKSSFELGKELFDSYPQMTYINGSAVMLRGVSKHFNSLEDCYFKYAKSIGFNIDKHNEIIELVNWAKESNILNKSLGAFVVDNSWLDLQSLREGNDFIMTEVV